MKINLIGSAYMAQDDIPHLVVSYKQFDEIQKQIQEGKPLVIDSTLSAGITAADAQENIYKSWGLEAPVHCAHCYQVLDK